MNSREQINQWVQEAAAGGEADSYAAKRGEVRFDCRWDMEMRLRGLIHKVITRDVSDNGVGVISEQEVKEGETIELRRNSDEAWVRVRVMHTTQTVGRFKLGTLVREEEEIRSLRGDEYPHFAESLLAMARIMISRGNFSNAESSVRECIEIRKTSLPEDHWLTSVAENILGECFVGRQRYEEAEPLLLDSFFTIRQQLGEDDERTVTALGRIDQLYEKWGMPERATEFREKLRKKVDSQDTEESQEDA